MDRSRSRMSHSGIYNPKILAQLNGADS